MSSRIGVAAKEDHLAVLLHEMVTGVPRSPGGLLGLHSPVPTPQKSTSSSLKLGPGIDSTRGESSTASWGQPHNSPVRQLGDVGQLSTSKMAIRAATRHVLSALKKTL